jgi:hypothetical protein
MKPTVMVFKNGILIFCTDRGLDRNVLLLSRLLIYYQVIKLIYL